MSRLWLVTKRENDLTRSVQIAAYSMIGEKQIAAAQLFFIPYAYAFDEEKLDQFTTAQALVNKRIRSVPVEDLRRSKNPQDVLMENLKKCWDTAKKVDRVDATKIKGKIPARSSRD